MPMKITAMTKYMQTASGKLSMVNFETISTAQAKTPPAPCPAITAEVTSPTSAAWPN